MSTPPTLSCRVWPIYLTYLYAQFTSLVYVTAHVRPPAFGAIVRVDEFDPGRIVIPVHL